MAAVIPAVSRLSKRVIRILGCNPGKMTLQGTNTYLLGTGKRKILIDAGEKGVTQYQTNVKDLMAKEDALIEHIVVTHWHHDHIGGVGDLQMLLTDGCKIWKHKKSSNDTPEDEMAQMLPINWLKDGQIISVEGATIVVHHTPGHTTDHVALTLKEENVIFSGDCILGEGTAVFEDLYTYMLSLHKILSLQPEKIYPGHGNIIQDPKAKIEYYISHRNQREKQILNLLKDNKDKQYSELEIVKLIYTDLSPELWLAASLNVLHHLNKLLKENKVKQLVVENENKWQYNLTSSL